MWWRNHGLVIIYWRQWKYAITHYRTRIGLMPVASLRSWSVSGILWRVYSITVMMSATASHITSPAIVYSTVYPDANQRKHQSSASLAFVRGIHRWPVNSPHKGPVTRKMFPFDDVILSAAYLFLKHVDSWRDLRYLGAHKTCHSVGSWQHPWLKQVGILHIIRSFNWNRKTDDVKVSSANIVIKRDPS